MIHLERNARRRAPWRVLLPLGLLAAVLVAGALLVSGCGGKTGGGAGAHDHAQQYHCPMHPTYVSDRQGDCPICGMKLVPIEPSEDGSDSTAAGAEPEAEAGGEAAGRDAGPRRILHYRNPMDPAVTSPVPMKDGMGMDYVPVYSDEVPGEIGIEGHAVVELKPEVLRLTGIRTAVATRGRLSRTVRTVGEVKADETRVRHVQTKISGWVEKLYVSFSGQAVRKGQPLLTLYSPELLATQEEFVRALEAAERFEQSTVPEVRRGGAELLEAARRRLTLFDVPQALIEQLERTRQPQRAVTLDAPVSGFVSTKEVFEGMQIEPGMALFTITDLSRVWIEAEVYEYEAALVRLGQAARVSLANDPGVTRSARISYIYPYLNPDARTLRVRFEFDNPGQVLKPGMYADVELEDASPAGVLVPDAAVMDTGIRQIVYVQTGPGRFEPRRVAVGGRSTDQVRILSGVKAGESVVVGANFLLDSESRLRAAIAGTAKSGKGGGNAP